MFITFLNPQGNFDRRDSRWASHPDFGGQLVYVKEVAVELAEMGHEVDIVTRQVRDEAWPEFAGDVDGYDGVENVRILRIPFGGDAFLEKERLWPHLCPGYVEGLLERYRSENRMPAVLAAHYGDGGLAAACLKSKTDIPYSFTAHSMGAQKMDKLRVNRFNIEELDGRYNFTLRLLAERISMNHADRIVTSTIQERFSQYTHTAYQEAVVIDNDDRFAVIPPGVSLKVFDRNRGPNRRVQALIERRLRRDIRPNRLNLPAVVASSRLDPKKNIAGLVRAFGQSRVLQEKANLVIVTRGYDNPLKNYRRIPEGKDRETLIELISLIDRLGLRGKVSMFSIENQEDLSALYRTFSKRRSVFCLTALYEPFGLAPLEAMASGLPAVVTKFGGPTESLREGDRDFGLLVDPKVPEEVAGALHSLVASGERWERFSEAGYRRVLDRYTWKRTAEGYLRVFEEIRERKGAESIFHVPIDSFFVRPDGEPKPSIKMLERLYLHYDVLCIGETTVDFISTKESNSLIDADTFTRYPGGNPAYVAIYVSKLSKKAVLLTKLGRGRFASFLERELQKYGVSTEHVSYSDEDDTSVAFLSHTPTVPDFQLMRSADRKLHLKEIDPELIERADAVYTSLSSLAHEPARSAVRKALRIAKRAGKMIVLDPNYHPKVWPDKEEAVEVLAQVCEGAALVKPSLTDARNIFDFNLPEERLIDLCLENFHGWGARTVLVTAKGRFVVASENGKVARIDDLPPVEVVDVTGGGRAFMSGFLVAYLERLPLEGCVHFGHEVARIALGSIGPFPKSIFRSEVLARIGHSAEPR